MDTSLVAVILMPYVRDRPALELPDANKNVDYDQQQLLACTNVYDFGHLQGICRAPTWSRVVSMGMK